MPKPRNPENKGLPARWQKTHGAYYYQVPPGLEAPWDGKKKFRLGKTLPEAYKTWSNRIGPTDRINNIGKLLDRYALEVIPTKAPKTQTNNVLYVSTLRKTFGLMPITAIRPQHIYQYVDKRSAKVAAHREIRMFSHVFTKAVEWGLIDRHPFKGQVRLGGEKPRTRYVEDWEIRECLTLPETRKKGSVLAIKAYIKLKLLIGLRRTDLLRLRVSDLREDGIHVETSKTRKRVIFTWTDELREAIGAAKAARPVHISPWLFCNKRGQCYIDEKTGEAWGWNTMWQRFITRVLKETKVKERFTEHDIRAKSGSDAESDERAQSLLTHSDIKTTVSVYRRKPKMVAPLR
jgi:integrase